MQKSLENSYWCTKEETISDTLPILERGEKGTHKECGECDVCALRGENLSQVLIRQRLSLILCVLITSLYLDCKSMVKMKNYLQ